MGDLGFKVYSKWLVTGTWVGDNKRLTWGNISKLTRMRCYVKRKKTFGCSQTSSTARTGASGLQLESWMLGNIPPAQIMCSQ